MSYEAPIGSSGESLRPHRMAAPLMLLLLIVAGFGAACGSAQAHGVRVAVAGAASLATSVPSTTGTARPNGKSVASPTITSLTSFVAKYGASPDATRGRLAIPRIGVDAPIGSRVVPATGLMPNPAGPADVVSYDFGNWPGYGGAPGRGGNEVFAGHLDYADRVPYAGADYRGEGVFWSLGLLAQGDEIDLAYNGAALHYEVLWVKKVSADGPQWASILGSKTEGETLTLITCGGDFDASTREYESRIVVRAIRR